MAIPSMVRRICALSVRIAVPVVRVQARQPIEPIVDRRRSRHDPPEGVRRHAEAVRHADALDPRQPAQVRALAADDRDLRLVNLLKIQHVLLSHCDTHDRDRTAGSTAGSTSPHPPYLDNNTRTSWPHFRRLWHRPTILRHDPGLAASPPPRYMLRVGRGGTDMGCRGHRNRCPEVRGGEWTSAARGVGDDGAEQAGRCRGARVDQDVDLVFGQQPREVLQ